MKKPIHFEISEQAIDVHSIRNAIADDTCGAYVAFEGWIRNKNEGRGVNRLEYEVYKPLAESEGQKILEEAASRFGLTRVVCVHRHGQLELGDCAVMVAVTAPHREEAFSGCRYVIDEVKARLPIWKKEHYSDGELAWVNCQDIASKKGAQ